jgi:aspartyl/asparaginyl beta-hydroxylase (cupin superfamily)
VISKFFLATGLVVWGGFALQVALQILNHHRVKRWLERPARYPYYWFLRHRVTGFFMAILRRLSPAAARRLPPEIVSAFRSARVEDFAQLRDLLYEVERLPTVRRGLDALGLRSIFEVPSRAVHKIPSPYTHPMQYPAYYLPGVPARRFYDPAEFEWAKALEDAFPVVKEELAQVLAADAQGFKAYMSEAQQHLTGWNTFNLFFYGKKFEANCARVPRTTALLESLPRFERDHIMFSALNPHARIPPHTGPMNGIIRAHLPLLVPRGCYIRVGPDERTWEEGKLLVFDDSFEHEVWNHSDQVRIVLFMNFWHPCFDAAEIPVLERFRSAYEKSPLGRVHEDNQAAERAHDLALKAAAAAAKQPTAAGPLPSAAAPR